MSLALCVDSMLAVGHHHSMNLKDLRCLCIKMMILSLKYVNQRVLWMAVLPEHYVDWGLVRPNCNLLGDLHMWIPLLNLCTWEGLERYEQQLAPLHSMRRALKSVLMDDGTLALPARLLIVHMLHKIPAMQAFELITCQTLKRDTHSGTALLLAALSETPYTPEEMEEAFAVLLGGCLRVDTAPMEAIATLATARKAELAASLKLQTVAACGGRPRIRDRVRSTEDQKAGIDTRLGTNESFLAFKQVHQFPNVLSDHVKNRLYFLASQTAWDWRGYVGMVLGHHGDLSAQVGRYPVSNPDLSVIHRVIDGLDMDGSPPFQAMLDFKNRCFKSFPVSQVRSMNLSQILRLYVSVYQNPAIWKEVWKLQLSLLSPQIIKDCEAFVCAEPFAADDVMRLMCR